MFDHLGDKFFTKFFGEEQGKIKQVE